jgi:IS605 OrfB family transposase
MEMNARIVGVSPSINSITIRWLLLDTGRGVAIEDLEGIRNRTRFRKKQRDRMSKRAFAELREYIEYKAALAGVKAQPVDPRDTSKRAQNAIM